VPEGGESKFNVAIYNYQSSARDPAVLAIVVNSSGSSAQVPYFSLSLALFFFFPTLFSYAAAGNVKQVLGNNEVWGGQKLFFNKNGQKVALFSLCFVVSVLTKHDFAILIRLQASFIGQRLKDNRAERGVAAEGAMTAEEKKQNVLMIIQVRSISLSLFLCRILCP
jgi:hypothetical protein